MANSWSVMRFDRFRHRQHAGCLARLLFVGSVAAIHSAMNCFFSSWSASCSRDWS